MNRPQPAIAVLIPCYNEEVAIAQVIDSFRQQLPAATIYVFDNCSTDATAAIASRNGAVVLTESRKGKGFVVSAMFDRIDADLYVLVDGDSTYPAEHVHRLLEPLQLGKADMVVGARLATHSPHAFPRLHLLGNRLVANLVNWVSGSQLTDIMSGYRAFNRQVVRRIPVIASGFEIETDLTLQVLYYRLKIAEVTVPYRERPAGSESKLRTFHDGFLVLGKIFTLFRVFKPLTFFGGLGLLLLLCGMTAGAWPIHDYFTEPGNYVRHVPLAILAVGLVLLAVGFMFLGILLNALNWRFLELHNVLTRENLPKVTQADISPGLEPDGRLAPLASRADDKKQAIA
jgi:glycosyltransferase involved in cell wall biosynthesis